MKKRTTLLVTAILLLPSAAADAREPFEDEPPPIPVPPVTDPVAFVVPAGLYYVTDTYVADVVATSDATTIYSTTTVHESTGTFARVIDTVDTGASSAFDGMAFNGRGALTNGQALAGTYYENFVLTPAGYVPVSIVFFQDDSETKRQEGLLSAVAPPKAGGTPAPGLTTVRRYGEIALSPATKERVPIEPAHTTLRAGIALAPDGPTLASAEVLRGRLIQFWPRAFANDVAVPIRSWRLLSARPDHISADTGSTQALAAQWIRMPAPGVTWSLRFEILPEVVPTERLEAEISVTLRSPAIVD